MRTDVRIEASMMRIDKNMRRIAELHPSLRGVFFQFGAKVVS